MFGWLYDRISDRILDSLVEKVNDEKFQKEFMVPLCDAVVDRQWARLASRVGGWNKTGFRAEEGIDLAKLAKGKITFPMIMQFLSGFAKGGRTSMESLNPSESSNKIGEVT